MDSKPSHSICRDTSVLICSMKTSEPTPISQVDSQEVSPTQKENLEPTRIQESSLIVVKPDQKT